MPVLTKAISSLFIKPETTEGTDAVPTGANALQLIEHATFSFGHEIQNPQTDLENQLLDEAFPVAPAGKWAEVTGKVWIRGLGSAYNGSTAIPEIDAILQAMGLAVSGTTTMLYDTASTGTKSVTVYGFRGTDTGVFVKYPILGARCSKATFRFPAGKPAELDFTLRGLFVQPSDASAITPTYQTSVPPLFAAANSWSLGSLTGAVLRDAEVSLELPLVPQLSGNVVDALAGYKPRARKATFAARFEAARIADYDMFTAWKTAPQNALSIALGSAANNKMTITADRATIFEAPAYDDDQGLWINRVSGLLTPEGTNRVKFTFAP